MAIDKKKAMHTFGISESDYDELLFEFAQICSEKIVQIEKALDSNNSEKTSEFIHSIKGMSGNMMLDDCFSAACAAEIAVKKGDLSGVNSALEKIRMLIKEIRTAIGESAEK